MNKVEKNLFSDKLIALLKNSLLKEKDVLFCYLFGSFSYQNFNAESDADIAVFLDETQRKNFFKRRLELITKLSKALNREADVTILNETGSAFFKYVVVKEGKLIFERTPQKRIDFELMALNQYFDFKPILKMYQARILTNKV
jgi:predicted nucleotidyltransferase